MPSRLKFPATITYNSLYLPDVLVGMKKWITSNYHYMVPEFDATTKIKPDFTNFLADVKRGVDFLGKKAATPVVLGPVSLSFLTRMSAGSRESLLGSLLPFYKDLLGKLAGMGLEEVQIHEPVLVFAEEKALLPLFQKTYPAVLPAGDISFNLVTSMDDVGEDHYKWMKSVAEFAVLSLDFTRGNSLELIKKFGFPKEKTLGVGLIDSRNVWKVQPDKLTVLLESLEPVATKVSIQPSGSLQYVPWDFECETALQSHPAAQVLAFAKQKIAEIGLLSKVAAGHKELLKDHLDAWVRFQSALPTEVELQVNEKDLARPEPYKLRRPKQLVGLPALPTTTIGSFPQTTEIRRLRTQWKKGTLTTEQYQAAIDQQISYAIGLQEALGLDILVHGEAERTDMVEFFAQQMDGMLFTANGWVQSFGSRCVRPPIFWTNITRPKAMTTREFKVAQALTAKPVKGMLTGPVTILNWSFPRIDIPRKSQAFQLARALRQEVADLEAAGCHIIQVDEPALREGMPLRAGDKDEYLRWAVDAFRLATAGASSGTQIHTHMCYCEFADCMDAIDRMDTDVNSIENARNGNETLEAFVGIDYHKGFGPGVYDIHSPVIPPVPFMEAKIKSFLQCLKPEQLVVNPDCGLKTRTWPETIAALKNMVAAAEAVLVSEWSEWLVGGQVNGIIGKSSLSCKVIGIPAVAGLLSKLPSLILWHSPKDGEPVPLMLAATNKCERNLVESGFLSYIGGRAPR
eukprot:scaffold2830_cov131-Cylindrotheca_fusiformis.AAC.97